MVSPEEYFYYLRKAFKKNHVHGYMIDCKANRKTCIYSENGKWVVSEIRSGVAMSPKEYDFDDLWHACEDIIARLSRDEEHRKKTWMDWASPTNWAEKMDVPIAIRKLSPEVARKLVKAKSQGISQVQESKGTPGDDILAKIDKGIDDMESGRVTPHEESMKIIRQRYDDHVKSTEE